jgi:hypothetical protein
MLGPVLHVSGAVNARGTRVLPAGVGRAPLTARPSRSRRQSNHHQHTSSSSSIWSADSHADACPGCAPLQMTGCAHVATATLCDSRLSVHSLKSTPACCVLAHLVSGATAALHNQQVCARSSECCALHRPLTHA